LLRVVGLRVVALKRRGRRHDGVAVDWITHVRSASQRHFGRRMARCRSLTKEHAVVLTEVDDVLSALDERQYRTSPRPRTDLRDCIAMGPGTPQVVSAHSQPVLPLWDHTTKTCEDVMNSPLDRRACRDRWTTGSAMCADGARP
jgi:hypothetical protein